jgi:hypothetical protein
MDSRDVDECCICLPKNLCILSDPPDALAMLSCSDSALLEMFNSTRPSHHSPYSFP